MSKSIDIRSDSDYDQDYIINRWNSISVICELLKCFNYSPQDFFYFLTGEGVFKPSRIREKKVEKKKSYDQGVQHKTIKIPRYKGKIIISYEEKYFKYTKNLFDMKPKPDWEYWGLIGAESPYRLVLLSMDIEPRIEKVIFNCKENSGLLRAWLKETDIYDEFDERFSLVASNSSNSGGVIKVIENKRAKKSVVDKKSFIKWINTTPLSLPKELIIENTQSKKKIELPETTRKKMLSIILGMAIDKYDYDPKSRKNHATGEKTGSISSGLDNAGLSVDSDTIREYLKEAVKTLLPASNSSKT